MNGAAHLHNAYEYVRTKQEAGAIVWAHRADEHWIDDPAVGIVLMESDRRRTRVFGVPQTPASGATE